MVRFSNRFASSLLRELNTVFTNRMVIAGSYPLNLLLRRMTGRSIAVGDIDIYLPVSMTGRVVNLFNSLFPDALVYSSFRREPTFIGHSTYEGCPWIRECYRIPTLHLNIIVTTFEWGIADTTAINSVLDTFDLDICKVAYSIARDSDILGERARQCIQQSLCCVGPNVEESRLVKYRLKFGDTLDFIQVS